MHCFQTLLSGLSLTGIHAFVSTVSFHQHKQSSTFHSLAGRGDRHGRRSCGGIGQRRLLRDAIHEEDVVALKQPLELFKVNVAVQVSVDEADQCLFRTFVWMDGRDHQRPPTGPSGVYIHAMHDSMHH